MADINFLVELAVTKDEASQLPHKFTLTSNDGNVNQTLTLASDAAAGDTEGTVVLTFTGLTEHHAYTLACDNGDTTYTVFKDIDYDQLDQIGPDGTVGSSTGSADAGSSGGAATGGS